MSDQLPPPQVEAFVNPPRKGLDALVRHRHATLAVAAVVALGCFIPWGSVGAISMNGMGRDGDLFLVMAIIATALSFWQHKASAIINLLLFAGIAFGALSDFNDVTELAADSVLVSAGVGLPVVIVGGVLGLIISGIRLTSK